MDAGTARRWSEAVLVGVVVYVVLDVLLVFLRPEFSVLHNAESDYGSAGHYAWVMDANFVLRGLLSLALVGALALELGGGARLRVALVLLGVWALGSALLAFFPDDPVGTKLQGAGRVHLALASVAFLCVTVGTLVASSALARDARFAPLRAPLWSLSLLAFLALLALGRTHLRIGSLGGLYEKLFLALELAWFALVAWRLARVEPGPPSG